MTTVTIAGVRPRRLGRGAAVAAVLACWLALGAALHGRWTLALAASDLSWLHRRLNDVNEWVGAHRTSSPPLRYVVDETRVGVDQLVIFLQHLISLPSGGRPVPAIGWLGVVAIAAFLAAVLGGPKVGVLAAAGLCLVGLQGLWQESMDTLALTLAAVLLAVLLGFPLGVAVGVSDRVRAALTPVLDVMQTMPAFVYLAPLTLFFLIGPAAATITTLIYAMPPVVRYTAHGIRQVPRDAVEAATSLGSTPWQRLVRVQLPMSRRLIVLGINQSIMAALSMVTVAALIDAPGLGKTVLQALESLDVGTACNAGLAIVVLAILLDRITSAAGRRAGATPARPQRSLGSVPLRRLLLAGGAVVTLVLVYLSRTYLWAARFPTSVDVGGRPRPIRLGDQVASTTTSATDWVSAHLSGLTSGLKDVTTTLLIDPLQSLLTQSPWWLVAAVIVVMAGVLGTRITALTAAICVALLVGSGLWQDSMTTLAQTLVATAVVVALGVVIGVWMARSPVADRTIRPVLDAAQTMPAFVYLVPFVALFAASRFTAIVAAVVYAAPVAIKIVADGVESVPADVMQAAEAAGSSSWQTVRKVQLPMARHALALAANQGLIYVLAMVVIGGLVGAGALGYDVVAGFSQGDLFGKGLAAGLAAVLLGILLDRITQAAAHRTSR